METLLSILTKLTNLPEQKLMPVLELFESIDVPANKTLLTSSSICSKIWFVGSGSLRAYYYQEERKRTKSGNNGEKTIREVTDWLVAPGGLYTPMHSFSQQVPTSHYVETLQVSHLFTLSHQNYLILKKSQPEVVFRIYEQAIIMYEMRLRMCNLHYPEERLRMFELTHRGMIGQIPVCVQASYLNIEPNTLSKFRGRSR